MITVSREYIINEMGPEHKAVAKAKNGDVVRFETLDCFANQIKNETMRMADIDESNANPATGPLYVEGAMPGDTLKVEILSIELDNKAVIGEFPGEGVTGIKATEEIIKILPITEKGALFSDELTLQLNPMIGVIGTAPADESICTEAPDCHGGNLDCINVCEGATLYLPVCVEGAMLAMGDLHALMGDGEVCVCGAEISGEVEVKVTVIKGRELPLPFLTSKDKCMAIHSEETLDEAAKETTFRMREFLIDCVGMADPEAGMLLSLVGDLRICQIVNPKKTCRMEMPLEIVTKLGYKFP